MSDVMLERPRAAGRGVREIVDGLGYDADFIWAFDRYKDTVVALAREGGLARHLDIGGGRDPLFQPDELDRFGFDVTLNDISSRELELAPDRYRKVRCDITAEAAPALLGRGCYDLAYCRMVMEHVADVPRMWRVIHEVLAPGGVAVSFFPTLYAPPFVLNRLVPETLSSRVLHAVDRNRGEDGDNPKFPAFYDHCVSRERTLRPMLARVGFSEVTVLPFWGYSYFWKFPVLRQVDAAFTALARRRDWRAVSSFAYVIARK